MTAEVFSTDLQTQLAKKLEVVNTGVSLFTKDLREEMTEELLYLKEGHGRITHFPISHG
jgi:hypothetical protein